MAQWRLHPMDRVLFCLDVMMERDITKITLNTFMNYNKMRENCNVLRDDGQRQSGKNDPVFPVQNGVKSAAVVRRVNGRRAVPFANSQMHLYHIIELDRAKVQR